MDPKGYYTCLGIDPSAAVDQIRAAYHRYARQCHPDLNPSPLAKARFQAINEAYQALSHPSRRAAYDHARWAAAVEDYKTRLASARWRRAELDGRSHALGSRLGLSAFAGALGLVSLALLF
jgi:DnaJ-class molecular chaperone